MILIIIKYVGNGGEGCTLWPQIHAALFLRKKELAKKAKCSVKLVFGEGKLQNHDRLKAKG